MLRKRPKQASTPSAPATQPVTVDALITQARALSPGQRRELARRLATLKPGRVPMRTYRQGEGAVGTLGDARPRRAGPWHETRSRGETVAELLGEHDDAPPWPKGDRRTRPPSPTAKDENR